MSACEYLNHRAEDNHHHHVCHHLDVGLHNEDAYTENAHTER
jgi:hypothetical protein